jgi:hypothetical protein
MFLNEITSNILNSDKTLLKKGCISCLLVIALVFYGIESLFKLLLRR